MITLFADSNINKKEILQGLRKHQKWPDHPYKTWKDFSPLSIVCCLFSICYCLLKIAKVHLIYIFIIPILPFMLAWSNSPKVWCHNVICEIWWYIQNERNEKCPPT